MHSVQAMNSVIGLSCLVCSLVACAATPAPPPPSVIVDATPILDAAATARDEPASVEEPAPSDAIVEEPEEAYGVLGILSGSLEDSAIFQLDPALSGLGGGFGGLGLSGSSGSGGSGIGGLGMGGLSRLGATGSSSAPSAEVRLIRPDPPPTLSRIVRRHFGAIRACYEEGLGADPALAGVVRIRLDITSDGAPRNVTSEGSTLPDGDTIQCITEVFEAMSFPSKTDAFGSMLFSLQLSSPKAPAPKP